MFNSRDRHFCTGGTDEQTYGRMPLNNERIFTRQPSVWNRHGFTLKFQRGVLQHVYTPSKPRGRVALPTEPIVFYCSNRVQ